MGDLAVIDAVNRRLDAGGPRAEASRRLADLPDVSEERFAGKAWSAGDVDSQSFVDAAAAINHLCRVMFTRT